LLADPGSGAYFLGTRNAKATQTRIFLGTNIAVIARVSLRHIQEQTLSTQGVTSLKDGTRVLIIAHEFSPRSTDPQCAFVSNAACISIITRESVGHIGTDTPDAWLTILLCAFREVCAIYGNSRGALPLKIACIVGTA
jgi:hypothetical protein